MLVDPQIIKKYGHIMMFVSDIEFVKVLIKLDMVDALIKYAIMFNSILFRNSKYKGIAWLVYFGLRYTMRLFTWGVIGSLKSLGCE